MALAEEYVWLLLHFSILTTFSIIAPLVSFAYLGKWSYSYTLWYFYCGQF